MWRSWGGKLAALPKNGSKPRMVVITQRADPTLVCVGGKFITSRPLPPSCRPPPPSSPRSQSQSRRGSSHVKSRTRSRTPLSPLPPPPLPSPLPKSKATSKSELVLQFNVLFTSLLPPEKSMSNSKSASSLLPDGEDVTSTEHTDHIRVPSQHVAHVESIAREWVSGNTLPGPFDNQRIFASDHSCATPNLQRTPKATEIQRSFSMREM